MVTAFPAHEPEPAASRRATPSTGRPPGSPRPVIPLPGGITVPAVSFFGWDVRWTRAAVILATFVLLGLVGVADYLSGYEISCLIFYLLPVSLASWYVGRTFAVAVSLLSAAVYLFCDLGAGAVYPNPFVPAWNVGIALGFFLVITWLLSSLRVVLLELEIRVCQRTVALTEEMAERERLEKDVLEISEREQRRIGHDLHDGLGQHLTGTALAGQVLAERLASSGLPEAEDAERIVALIEDGIELTRSLARGLSPVALAADGLAVALAAMADQTTAQFYLPCVFQAIAPVQLHDPAAATHLYRIAQEAVGNAIRHGRPDRIEIDLDEGSGNRVTLTVRDDGIGLPPEFMRDGVGLGLRIMAHRTRMIGATLDVRRGFDGGTVVQCVLAVPAAPPVPVEYDHLIPA